MTQERIPKKIQPQQETTETEEPEPHVSEEAEALKKETDELLDEIDSVLEENAEDFVRNYIQKGGQ